MIQRITDDRMTGQNVDVHDLVLDAIEIFLDDPSRRDDPLESWRRADRLLLSGVKGLK